MPQIKAKVIADSISEFGKRITTLEITCHRYILAEMNTHRVFSRNFSSSRAIPTAKLLEMVRNDPAMPVHWGKNQPGMQAKEELTGAARTEAETLWRQAANNAANIAEQLAGNRINCHKQIVNRVLEPFLFVTGIITSTEWDNWFELRDHEDAQPEICVLAKEMRNAITSSAPKLIKFGDWHLPYITDEEKNLDFFKIPANKNMLQKISAARCCRVSYLKHDGTSPNIDEDLALFMRLAGSVPIHSSPLEHVATPLNCDGRTNLSGNFFGWNQYRHIYTQNELDKGN